MGQHEELNKIDRYHDIDFRDDKKKWVSTKIACNEKRKKLNHKKTI